MTETSFDKIRLGVGLADSHGYGYTILEQSGIPKYLISSVEDGIASGLRIFFWNNNPELLKVTIEKYPEISFAVITTHDYIGNFFNETVGTATAFTFCPDDNNESKAGNFYLNQKVFIYPAANIGVSYTKYGDKIKDSGIFILQLDNVILISFPWDFLNFRLGSVYSFRPFYSGKLKKNFVEIGPPVDLARFRKLVIDNVIYASDKLGLPLIALKNPFHGGKYFSMRIDADGFQQNAISEVLKVSNLTGLKFTWFIDVKGWHGNLGSLKVLSDNQQTIQFHCYNHMTYRSKFLNKVNIKKGLSSMKKHQVEPDGIVSPNGFYPAGFAEAISDFGFQYSSEFGYDVDDLPSWPGNDMHHPLQIPVHSGSFGVFLPAGFTDPEVFEHLHQSIRERVSNDGLAILYEHPYYFQNRSTLWNDFFQGLFKDGFEYLSFAEIAKIWKYFIGHSLNATFDRQSAEIQINASPADSQIVQLNTLTTNNEKISFGERTEFLNSANFILTDNEGVEKEIKSRQWILDECNKSIIAWFVDYYWFYFKILVINGLKTINLYKR